MKEVFDLVLNATYSPGRNRIYMPLATNRVVTLVLITNGSHDFYEKKLLALFNSYFKIYKEQRR
jgi:hypothetical protein